MSHSINKGRRLTLVAAFGLTAVMAPLPAQAGFLDQLFGGIAPQASAPAQMSDPSYSAPQQPDDFGTPIDRRADRARSKKKVAQIDRTPVLQKTTDLMSDKTLRPGDAVMMKSGVHVYDGPESSHHDADQFVALDQADHLKSGTRAGLVAMDATRRNPLVFAASTSTLVEGRSVAARPALAQGYRITDARGRSIRYVGP